MFLQSSRLAKIKFPTLAMCYPWQRTIRLGLTVHTRFLEAGGDLALHLIPMEVEAIDTPNCQLKGIELVVMPIRFWCS